MGGSTSKLVFQALFYVLTQLIFFFAGILSKKFGSLKGRTFFGIMFLINTLVPTYAFGTTVFTIIALNVVSIMSLWAGLKVPVIGLTGGIACGKSTVSNIFKREGYTIIDADEISHELRRSNRGYQNSLINAFGKEVWDEDKKEINSEKLGQIVFADPIKRRQLNKLTHGKIFREMLWQIFKYKLLQGRKNVILDVPLLFETKVLE